MLRPSASGTSRVHPLQTIKAFMKDRKRVSIPLMVALCTCLAFAAISIPLGSPYVQNFDGMGIPATTTTASTLPADFRVDNPTAARTVGNFATALTTVARAGGANLSSSASNGIYSFGAGTTALGNSDRAVGFLSSGTATGSGNLYAQLVNSTAGDLSGLQISYNVEKYRLGINPAGFRIQLFYSTDGATWTNAGPNFTTTFPGDSGTVNSGFATVPGATVAVTNQNLPVTIPAGSTFYLAWNYSVASGTTTTNAQALAVDDISIVGLGNVTTNPTAVGAASPSTVQAGNSSRLTVQVSPGANPTSTGITVTADLSSIGGSSTQQFFDDGSNGDQVTGDNVFTFNATVPAATVAGGKVFSASVTDGQGRTASTSISLTVTPSSTPPSGVGSANPASLMAGSSTLLTVTTASGTNPASSGIAVTADLSSIGGSSTQQFFDDGTHGDTTGGDGVFSFTAAVASGTTPGSKSLAFTVTDAQSRIGSGAIALSIQPPPPPNTIKISQVYGGGGNSGATYTNDFIELFNNSNAAVDISGWSVQEASATVTGAWAVTPICPQSGCTIQPGHYFLVQEGPGAGGTTAPPSPDASGTIALSATSAKVAVVASTLAVSGSCPTGGSIVDMVGYGTATCFETTATPVLSNTTAALRKNNGCIDTDSNQNDFIVDGPIPRNSSSPANFCGATGVLSGQGLAKPNSVLPATDTLLTVTVTPGTNSTGISVVGDLSAFNGNSTQQFYDDGTHGDVTAGDNVFSFSAPAPLSTGLHATVANITDAQSHTASAPITMTVVSPTCGVERWTVKVGSDPDAHNVDLNTDVRAAIADLGAIPPPPDPPGPPDNARVVPFEVTKYVINGTLMQYKLETDVDYHLVVDDGTGRTMIVEIPNPACILDNAAPRKFVNGPFNAAIAAARQKFDNKLTAQTFFQIANIPVQIKGVAFFDFEHGQTGIAPNGIELHPVLEINFPVVSTTTLVSSLNPSQANQNVTLTATVTGSSTTATGNVTFQDGGTPIGTAPLDASGKASFTTNSLSVGTHSLRASFEGDSNASNSISAPLLQQVNKLDQTVTLDPIADHLTTDAPFTVHAVASSGLPVTYSILSGPATISGNTVTLTGVTGNVVVQASQAGDSTYNPASASQSFAVILPCGTDLTGSFTVTKGPSQVSGPGTWTQTVTITNNSGSSIAAPVALVLDNLWPGETIANATGQTSCAAPAGHPYLDSDSSTINPGDSRSYGLTYKASGRAIRTDWTPRILSFGRR